MQNCPSLTMPLPFPGVVNEVVQGMYLPPSNVVLPSSSCPDSFGTSTPGDPLVGGAFQSAAALAGPGAGAAGAAAAGGAAVGAGAAAAVVDGGVDAQPA